MEPLKDYSQAGEQAAILRALHHVTPQLGRFLEIGAWHPTQFSNTRALFELGWSGVMLEPSPGPMRNLLREYGVETNVTLIQAAAGLEMGHAEMWITDDGMSTADVETHIKWGKEVSYLGKMIVPVLTLEYLSNAFGHFQFWSIDAEGISPDLFLRMLSLDLEPKCICVEYDKRFSEICAAATAKFYKLVFSNGTNAIFAR